GGARGRCHPRHIVLAIGFRGVQVKIAAKIGAIDEPRQRVRFGPFDLAAQLAQLGWYPVEPKCGVEVFFAFAGNPAIVGDGEKPVLVQLESEPDGTVAQCDVVSLRTREVLQRRAAALGSHEPKVCLEASLKPHARFRVALTEYA